MSAYLVADVLAEDVDGYRASGYLQAAMETAASHGGRYRIRGGNLTVLEGDWVPGRLVVIEFPAMDDLLEWYRSAEYQEWAAVRRHHAPDSKLIAVEGID